MNRVNPERNISASTISEQALPTPSVPPKKTRTKETESKGAKPKKRKGKAKQDISSSSEPRNDTKRDIENSGYVLTNYLPLRKKSLDENTDTKNRGGTGNDDLWGADLDEDDLDEGALLRPTRNLSDGEGGSNILKLGPRERRIHDENLELKHRVQSLRTELAVAREEAAHLRVEADLVSSRSRTLQELQRTNPGGDAEEARIQALARALADEGMHRERIQSEERSTKVSYQPQFKLTDSLFVVM